MSSSSADDEAGSSAASDISLPDFQSEMKSIFSEVHEQLPSLDYEDEMNEEGDDEAEEDDEVGFQPCNYRSAGQHGHLSLDDSAVDPAGLNKRDCAQQDPLATPEFGSGEEELPEDRERSPLPPPPAPGAHCAQELSDMLAKFIPQQPPVLDAASVSLDFDEDNDQSLSELLQSDELCAAGGDPEGSGCDGNDVTLLQQLAVLADRYGSSAWTSDATSLPPSSSHSSPRGRVDADSMTDGRGVVAVGTSTREPDTVFLDLRNRAPHDEQSQRRADNMYSIRRILRLGSDGGTESSDSDSESGRDSEDETVSWEKQRLKVKQTQTKGTSCSLQLKQTPAAEKLQTTPTAEGRGPTASARRRGNGQVAKSTCGVSTVTTKTVAPPVAHEERETAERGVGTSTGEGSRAGVSMRTVMATAATPGETLARRGAEAQEEKVPSRAPPQGSKAKKSDESAKKQRERQVRMRESRQRVRKQLEAMAPTMSAGERQAMAEVTGLIYDEEESYRPAVRPLPEVLPPDTVLVSVLMSSSGQITEHRTCKPIDTGLTYTFPILLSWLLHLVPAPGGAADAADEPACPFSVIGLQQLWMNGQLQLAIAAVPDARYQVSPVKHRRNKRDEMRTPFQHAIAKFLSANTLHSAAPWTEVALPPMKVAMDDDEDEYCYAGDNPTVSSKPLSTFIQVNADPHAVRRVFGAEPGFFWQTVDVQGCLPAHVAPPHADTDNAVCLLAPKMYTDYYAVHHCFSNLYDQCMDVAGLRLVYVSAADETKDLPPFVTKGFPVLAVAARGCGAQERLLRLLGPLDPALAKRTDPCSISAAYGGRTRDDSIVFYPRSPAGVRAQLARWFGGRVPHSGSFQATSASGARSKNTMDVFLLNATTQSSIVVIVAASILPSCYGNLLAHCSESGFQLAGIRRGHLSGKRLSALGVQKSDCRWFVPQTYHEPMSGTLNTLPCLALVLYKENAVFHMHPLAQICMCNLAITAALNDMRMAQSEPVTTRQCLHLVQYATSTVQTLGGHFFKVPDYLELSQPHVYSHPELCQIAVITLVGYSVIQKAGHIMTSLTSGTHGFELIGLKWLPSLSHQQAAAITRAEPGDATWRASITHLTQAGPAVVLAVRGLDAYTCLLRSLATDDVYYVSPSPAVAYRQLRGFFYDNELFPDSSANDLLKLLPPSHQHAVSSKVAPPSSGREPCGDAVSAAGEEHVLASMLVPPVAATSLLVLKPGVAERHAGRLLRKLSLSGFTVIALRLEMLPPALADAISPRDVSHEQHLQHLASGPCLALAVQRVNAVKKMLDLVGPTDPARARTYSPCFWRSLYGKDSVANAFYAPDSYASATTAVRLFFPDGVCCRATAEMSRAGVAEQTEDAMCTSSPRACTVLPPEPGCLHTSPLVEVSCLVLLPPLVPAPGAAVKPAPYVQVVEELQRQRFSLVGARMTRLSEPQQARLVKTCELRDDKLVALLARGPCLLLAVQRDNAVSCFTQILRDGASDSVLVDYCKLILRPKTTAQACDMLALLFDRLMPGSRAEITTATAAATK